jgi:predicted AAA+ superfamily ATPase
MLAHLEDAFLVSTLPVANHSERRQQVNLRKLYLADHSLAVAYNPFKNIDRGRYLEKIVACELLRQGSSLAYVKTGRGHEVDFLATQTDGRTQLIQVAADIENESTLQRELRSLEGASEEFRRAQKILLAEKIPPRGVSLPKGVEVIPIWQWLLCPATFSDRSASFRAAEETLLSGTEHFVELAVGRSRVVKVTLLGGEHGPLVFQDDRAQTVPN